MKSKRKRLRKIIIAAYLTCCGGGYRKAEFLKKTGIFKLFGDSNYWFPRITPADPEMVSIHNNVKVATNVYFCTHDVLHNLFNDAPNHRGGGTKGTLLRLKYSIMCLLVPIRQLCMA